MFRIGYYALCNTESAFSWEVRKCLSNLVLKLLGYRRNGDAGGALCASGQWTLNLLTRWTSTGAKAPCIWPRNRTDVAAALR